MVHLSLQRECTCSNSTAINLACVHVQHSKTVHRLMCLPPMQTAPSPAPASGTSAAAAGAGRDPEALKAEIRRQMETSLGFSGGAGSKGASAADPGILAPVHLAPSAAEDAWEPDFQDAWPEEPMAAPAAAAAPAPSAGEAYSMPLYFLLPHLCRESVKNLVSLALLVEHGLSSPAPGRLVVTQPLHAGQDECCRPVWSCLHAGCPWTCS